MEGKKGHWIAAKIISSNIKQKRRGVNMSWSEGKNVRWDTIRSFPYLGMDWQMYPWNTQAIQDSYLSFYPLLVEKVEFDVSSMIDSRNDRFWSGEEVEKPVCVSVWVSVYVCMYLGIIW